jgi:uncharacterized protein YidB (DUF937 family)
MALLDDLVGSVLTAVAGDKAPALNQFLQANGGVTGLADKFQRGGAGEVFASWVSTNDNQAITADQINSVLGNAQVQEFAQRMGVDPAQASAFIAQHLPKVIDQLTPSGQVPS